MKRYKTIFIYMCLTCIIGTGMVSIIGTGGGDTPPPSDPGDINRDQDPPVTDSQPKFQGFDFQLKQGDFWEFSFDYYESSYAQGSSGSTTRKSGTFRVVLGSPKVINDVTTYEVQISGQTGVGDTSFAPIWKHIGISEKKILGSLNGSSLVTLFDAQTGSWPGGGFFADFPDVLFAASPDTLSNDYINTPAIKVGRSDSESQCEYFPGIGSICGDSSYDWQEYEYFLDDVGPVGYYYRNSFSDCGGGFCSGATWEYDVGLVRCSFWGDVAGYDFEVEPNDSPDAAMEMDLFGKIRGAAGAFDDGSNLPDIAESESNEFPDSMQSLPYMNAKISGDIMINDAYSIVNYGANWTGPEDCYSFTLNQTETVGINLAYTGGETHFFLFKNTGSNTSADIIASYERSSGSRTITETLTSGDYFIGVVATDLTTSRNYYELSFFKGSWMTVQDWFEFSLPSTATGTITLDIDDSAEDLDLYLLNGEGTQVLGSSTSGSSDTESITDTLSPGTYLIGVKAVYKGTAKNNSTYELGIQ